MPRYLRWIAAATAGLVAQLAFSIAAGALLLETQERRNEVVVEVSPATLVLQLVGALVAMLVALGVNDWLSSRYPLQRAPAKQRP